MREISDIEKFYCKETIKGCFFTKICNSGALRAWLQIMLNNKFKRLHFIYTGG